MMFASCGWCFMLKSIEFVFQNLLIPVLLQQTMKLYVKYHVSVKHYRSLKTGGTNPATPEPKCEKKGNSDDSYHKVDNRIKDHCSHIKTESKNKTNPTKPETKC